MEKLKTVSSLTLGCVLFLIIGFYSCTENNILEQKKLTHDIISENNQALPRSGTGNVNTSVLSLNEEDYLNKFSNEVSTDISVDDTKCYVLYEIDGAVSAYSLLKYSSSSDAFQHTFFDEDNGVYVQNLDFTVTTNNFMQNDFERIIQSIDNASDIIIEICENNESPYGHATIEMNQLRKLLFDKNNIFLPALPTDSTNSNKGCAAGQLPCGADPNTICVYSPGMGLLCGGLCPAMASINYGNQNGHSIPSYMKSNLAYSFRDNFLKNTERGDTYIKYFYYISDALKTTDYLNYETFILAKETYKVADKIINGESSQIIIDADYYNLASNYLADFNVNHANSDIQAICLNIQSDLDEMKDKTLQEFIDVFFN